MICTVPRLSDIPTTPLDPRWESLPRLAVASYHAKSSAHRPAVHVQLGHSGDHLHLRFTVQDRYVLSRATGFNAMVCKDSCVEFFFEPVPGRGYFNLEMSAGGAPLCYHITDAQRVPDGFAAFEKLTADELSTITITGTLPGTLAPEITTPLDWALCACIPLAPFAYRIGCALPVPGNWRGNFYKCADGSSHPHWGSWAPIGEQLNFHQPERFGVIKLAGTPR
jgi:hypothetical protein